MNESLMPALCEMQAQLFVQSREKGYASEAFIKAFMNSDIAEELDMPFNHMQWAGTYYLMSRMEEEHGEELTQGELYHTMSPEMAIDRLKESYLETHRKS